MKKAGSIISIIAGVFGVIAAVIEMSIGGIGHVAEVEGAADVTDAASLGLIASFAIIIFGAIQNSSSKKWVSITLVGVSLFGMLFGGTFVAVCLLLSLIGGILGWIEHRNSKAVASIDNIDAKEEIKDTEQTQTLTRKGLKLALNAVLVVFIIFFLALIWGGVKGVTDEENQGTQAVTDNLDIPACASEEGISLVKTEMNRMIMEHGVDVQLDALRRGSNAGVMNDEVIDIHNAAEIGTSEEKKTRYCSGTVESKLSGNVQMFYDFRKLNDGTIHVTVSQHATTNDWNTQRSNETKADDNVSKAAVEEDNSHYVDDGDDDTADGDAGQNEGCKEDFPCRLKWIISKKDWKQISSALSFGFQEQTTERIHWENKESGHKGFVAFSKIAKGNNCKKFDMVGYVDGDLGNDEIIVCRDDSGVLTFH